MTRQSKRKWTAEELAVWGASPGVGSPVGGRRKKVGQARGFFFVVLLFGLDVAGAKATRIAKEEAKTCPSLEMNVELG